MTTESRTIRSTNPLTVLLTSSGFVFVLRVFLGAMLVYSSLHKVQAPEGFAIAIRGYKMVPMAITNLFALSIAWGELLVGVLLLCGLFTRQAAAACFILLVTFTIAITTTIVRGIAVDCGCFSNEGGHQTGWALVIRNLFLIVASLMVLRFDRRFLALDRLRGQKASTS